MNDPETEIACWQSGFEEWWTELEGFSMRAERAAEELGAADFPRLRAWLEAAYRTGFERAKAGEA